MIRIKDVIDNKTNKDFPPQVYTDGIVYDIELQNMDNDNFEHLRIRNRIMLWFNKKGEIGEIEAIALDDTVSNQLSDDVLIQTGIPVVEILDNASYDKNGWIEKRSEGFIIWFEENNTCDTVIRYHEIVFFAHNSILIGVGVQNMQKQGITGNRSTSL